MDDDAIGCQHLLLGIMREPGTLAAEFLVEHGLKLDALRAELLARRHEPDPSHAPSARRVTKLPEAGDFVWMEGATFQVEAAEISRGQGAEANLIRLDLRLRRAP